MKNVKTSFVKLSKSLKMLENQYGMKLILEALIDLHKKGNRYERILVKCLRHAMDIYESRYL